jgi:hypothetical protein
VPALTGAVALRSRARTPIAMPPIGRWRFAVGKKGAERKKGGGEKEKARGGGEEKVRRGKKGEKRKLGR